jgi:hypothetical protein
LNPKPTKVRNHGHIEPEGLYHENVRILDRFREQIWRENRVEMRTQTMANVIPIFIAHVPSLLHQKHIGVTYVGISTFKMELVRYVPLFSMAMP